MSNIYDKNLKQIRKELRNFGKTTYGKTVFLIAYLIPASLFLAMIIVSIIGLCAGVDSLITYMPQIFIAFVLSFVLANAYYYKELRVYINSK